jgi:hypothetical protein
MNEATVWIISAAGIVVTILMYAGGIAESNRRA